jgi:hypothetical protein
MQLILNVKSLKTLYHLGYKNVLSLRMVQKRS